jgi:CelD/BcsL family acetyltransferase involved in cellulose biosynthesis
MRLIVDRLIDDDGLSAIAAEWDALDTHTGLRTPFTGSHWNRLWLKHLRAARWYVRDEVHTFVVRAPDGQLIAIAPMMRTTRPGAGPFRMRTAQFIGADPNMTEVRRLVCRPEDEARATTAIMTVLSAEPDRWDRVEWTGLAATDGVAWSDMSGEAGETVPMYYLRLPDTWDAFRASRSRNIKESLRKCYNSLKRDAVPWTFTVVGSPGAMRAAVDRFLALHRARAAARVAVAHHDVFATAESTTFLHEYFETMAAEGRGFVFQLVIDDVVVATRLAVACGTTLYLYYSGFDQAWAKYSVMTTTVAESIKWAIENGYEIVNLSTGNDVAKTRWGPEEATFQTRILRPKTSRARVLSALYQRVRRVSTDGSMVARFLARDSPVR